MPKFIDLTGIKFHRLEVLRRGVNAKDRTTWVCMCECGTEKTIHSSALISGAVKSCGCYHRERISQVFKTHGLSRTQIYKTYYAMLARCYREGHPSFPDYGARGITVCDEWLADKIVFIRWSLQNGYSPELSIDRIDNDKGYSPDNCRWVDMQTQAMNKRGLRMITVDGVEKHLSHWLAISGVTSRTFYERVASGWSEVDAATRPGRPKKPKQTAHIPDLSALPG